MAFLEGTLDVSSTPQQPFTRIKLGFQPGNLFITVEDVDVRFWYGGGAPSPADGHLLQTNQNATFRKTNEIENLQLVSTGGAAKVRYTVQGV